MVRGWAFSRLGLSMEGFYLMRPGEFWDAMIAWREDKVADRRHYAEVIRGAALRLFNIQLQQKDRILDARKFFPFPWDEFEEDSETQRLLSLPQKERDKAAREFLDSINW